jgi:hypothetical protein
MDENNIDGRPWLYQVTVPARKTDDFIDALRTLGLTGEDNLEVILEGD